MSVLIERTDAATYVREDATGFQVDYKGNLLISHEYGVILVYAPGTWAAVELLDDEEEA